MAVANWTSISTTTSSAVGVARRSATLPAAEPATWGLAGGADGEDLLRTQRTKESGMPKIDPDTLQPITDDPMVEDPDQRGGREEDDEGMEGAKPTGGRLPKLKG